MRLYQVFAFNLSVGRVHETIISFLFRDRTCATRLDSLRIQWIYRQNTVAFGQLLFGGSEVCAFCSGEGVDDPLNHPNGILTSDKSRNPASKFAD